MTKRTAKQTETAAQAFERNKAEALRRLALLTAAVEAAGQGKAVDWGHVGSMSEVVKNLGHTGHWAGVAELTEK